jgi:hypothetical protein
MAVERQNDSCWPTTWYLRAPQWKSGTFPFRRFCPPPPAASADSTGRDHADCLFWDTDVKQSLQDSAMKRCVTYPIYEFLCCTAHRRCFSRVKSHFVERWLYTSCYPYSVQLTYTYRFYFN